MRFSVSYGVGSAKGSGDPESGDYDNEAVTSVIFDVLGRTKDIMIPITDDSVAEGD